MDQTLRSELIRDEGLRLQAYKDSVGLWTIGVGHLLGDTQRMTSITMAEADALLDADIVAASVIARDLLDQHTPKGSLFSWHLMDMVRQRALINMAFNLGNRLGQFNKFLNAFAAAELTNTGWTEVTAHMLDSKWATQVGQRAQRLAKMIETGAV